jgi:hypothetical protein
MTLSRDFKFSKPGSDGDMLYRSSSGLYVPASLGDFQVPQKQPDGTVIGVDVAVPADLDALETSLQAYTDAKLAGLAKPLLDVLRPELDFTRRAAAAAPAGAAN